VRLGIVSYPVQDVQIHVATTSDNLRHAVALHFIHHKFCRVNQTLKTRRPMAAGGPITSGRSPRSRLYWTPSREADHSPVSSAVDPIPRAL